MEKESPFRFQFKNYPELSAAHSFLCRISPGPCSVSGQQQRDPAAGSCEVCQLLCKGCNLGGIKQQNLKITERNLLSTRHK